MPSCCINGYLSDYYSTKPDLQAPYVLDWQEDVLLPYSVSDPCVSWHRAGTRPCRSICRTLPQLLIQQTRLSLGAFCLGGTRASAESFNGLAEISRHQFEDINTECCDIVKDRALKTAAQDKSLHRAMPLLWTRHSSFWVDGAGEAWEGVEGAGSHVEHGGEGGGGG